MGAKKRSIRPASSKRSFVKSKIAAIERQRNEFLERRPHRSFRRTLRRDLPKRAALPGYLSYTIHVLKIIKRNKSAYVTFLLLYLLASILFVGIANQENYQALTDSFKSLGSDIAGGDVGMALQTTALFGAAVTGGLSEPLTEAQQIYAVLIGVFAWLAIVWYLRHVSNNVKIRVRDALYNSGAPFIPTVIVMFILALQLVPGAIGVLIYAAADTSGLLDGGVEAMMFAVAAVLLCTLSIYWATSSFFAALITTIPGTYPYAALKMAGDIVIGRRASLMFRLLWLLLVLLILWAVVLIPMILIAASVDLPWLPLVPVTIQLLSAASVLFGASYIYLLYRKMIDEPAA